MKFLATLVLILGLATVALAGNNNTPANDCPGNSCHGGAGGDGGNASAQGGDGGNASSVSGSASQAAAISGALAGSSSGSSAAINDNSSYDYTESTVAPNTTAASAAVDNICGNVSGVSGSGGVFGGGLNIPSVECQIHKHLLFQQAHAGTPAAKFETFCFWFLLMVIVCFVLVVF